jgi:hypothetical protein
LVVRAQRGAVSNLPPKVVRSLQAYILGGIQMNQVSSKFTVLFMEPFWVGVYEVSCGGSLEAAKVVFGAEPKDTEVYEYLLKNWKRLCFSPSVEETKQAERKENPKRMQREIQHQVLQTGIGTKAQQALKLQQEQSKSLHRQDLRKRTEEEKQWQFHLRQQKKKEKHKGR